MFSPGQGGPPAGVALARLIFPLLLLVVAVCLASVSWIVSARTDANMRTVEKALAVMEAHVVQVVYEQTVQTPAGENVIVRTYKGEADSEAALYALHKQRVALVKGG